MNDSYNLERFVVAQASVYQQVVSELQRGRKTTHWMWFIFPQIAGLGSSFTAQKFAIGSLDEARAYLGHPVLGTRLRACTELVNAIEDRPIEDVFDYPDDLKFWSSMTLFHAAESEDPVFQSALERWFRGRPDPNTVRLLSSAARK